MKQSSIGWTDYSGNFCNVTSGCTPQSEGCSRCYARAIYERFGKDFSVTEHPDRLDALAKARFPESSPKRGYPHKPMAFIVDAGDLFHEQVSDAFTEDVLYVLKQRRDVNFQLLTKRADVMRDRVLEWMAGDGLVSVPENIWLGVTVENNRRMEERVPVLLQIPAIRFLSIEPCLEEIDCIQLGMLLRQGIHWVIVGFESGPKRRPGYKEWAMSIRDTCQAFNVPFFFKQGNGMYPGMDDLLEGRTWKEWPSGVNLLSQRVITQNELIK